MFKILFGLFVSFRWPTHWKNHIWLESLWFPNRLYYQSVKQNARKPATPQILQICKINRNFQTFERLVSILYTLSCEIEFKWILFYWPQYHLLPFWTFGSECILKFSLHFATIITRYHDENTIPSVLPLSLNAFRKNSISMITLLQFLLNQFG